MNRLFQKLMFVAVLGLASEAMAITQDQGTVGPALEAIGFVNVTPKGVIGGNQEYRGSHKVPGARTTFWLKADGTITFRNLGEGNAEGASATAEQGLIQPVLERLGFQYLKPNNGVVGGVMQFTTPRQTSRNVRNTR